MREIFIRPLTPLGVCKQNWNIVGYSAGEFISFYKECLEYIIDLNSKGIMIQERNAIIFLRKILTGEDSNYMELRSPCGGVFGQLAYNYDGGIFTYDEGRMVAEDGDFSFKIGNVFSSTFKDLKNSISCKTLGIASCLESLPGCSECVYSPYCGICPICNYAQNNSLFAQMPNNYRCKIYKGILNIIFEKILSKDDNTMSIFGRWLE